MDNDRVRQGAAIGNRLLRRSILTSLLWSASLGTAAAVEYVDVTPPPPEPEVPSADAVAPSPASFQTAAAAKPAEQQKVEAVLGARDLSRDYHRYTLVHAAGSRPSFARFMSDEYAARRRSGIVLAGVLAPIFAVLTAVGSTRLYAAGKEDEGGWCKAKRSEVPVTSYTPYPPYSGYPETTSAPDDYSQSTYQSTDYDDGGCEGDEGELIGIILVSTFGSLATVATLVPGVVKIAKYNKRINRLKPLADTGGAVPLSFRFGISPQNLFVGFSF